MPIPVGLLGLKEVLFTHIENGVSTSWVVNRMFDHAKKTHMEAVRIAIEDDYAIVCLMRRGIEPHRVSRLTPEQLEIPVIYVNMEDGTHLLVDGNHRYVRAYLDGKTTLKAFVFSKREADLFVVSGMPTYESEAQLLKSKSGL